MKYLHCLFVVLCSLLISCEDVVDVDLNTAAPRLVIDASINWVKGTAGNEQAIRLSTTGDYFDNEVPPVTGAQVFITNSDGNVFNFVEEPETGMYFCQDFLPEIGETYQLNVIHDGEIYQAQETLNAVPAIDFIEQNNEGGFTGEDIEIKVFFTDNGMTDDYYLFDFRPSYAAIFTFDLAEDRFFQGNQIFGIFSSDELAAGDNLKISISGISERYYNYMNILIGIAGSNGGSPFQSPPATVRGNIINTTQQDNYALGYFSVAEKDSVDYVIE